MVHGSGSTSFECEHCIESGRGSSPPDRIRTGSGPVRKSPTSPFVRTILELSLGTGRVFTPTLPLESEHSYVAFQVAARPASMALGRPSSNGCILRA